MRPTTISLRAAMMVAAALIATPATEMQAQLHANLINADVLWYAPWKLTGAGRKVGMFEGGGFANTIHKEFYYKRVTIGKTNPDGASDYHATGVASVICSRGVRPETKGVAYASKVQSYYVPDDESQAALFKSLFTTEKWSVTNHSYSTRFGWHWSSSQNKYRWDGFLPKPSLLDPFGAYLNESRLFDSVVYAANYVLPVVTAGNQRGERPAQGDSVWFYVPGQAGYRAKYDSTMHPGYNGGYFGTNGFDCLPPTACAKNVVTVGCVNSMSQLSTFSQTGPTNDGRIKPDVVALGEGVELAGSEVGLNGYQTLDGTSFAAPAVSGVIALLQQLFLKYFTVDMLPSTAKALLIHTAQDLGRPGPDYHYGWGLVNALEGARLLERASTDGVFAVNEFRLVQNVNQHFFIKADAAGSPITVTIVWSDPPGKVTEGGATDKAYKTDSSPRLVNDLDLWIDRKVNGITTEVHRPWVLDPANPKNNATRGTNVRDNVEQVLIRNPEPNATYRVNIVNSGPLSTAEQLFSRCVSGASLYLPPPGTLSATAAGGGAKADDVQAFSVNIAWERVPEAATYELRYRKQGTVTWTKKTGIATNTTLITGIELATYEFQVAARRGPTSSTYKTLKKTFSVTPIVPKNLVTSAITATSAKYSWTGDPNATGYRVLYCPVDADGNIKGGGWITIHTTATSYTHSGLAQDTKYAWCVQSKYQEDIKSESSIVVGYVTGTTCSAYEPNDAIAMARPIDVNRSLNARACKDDKSDWYAFVVTAGKPHVRAILYKQAIPLRASIYRMNNGNAQLLLESPDNQAGMATKYVTLNNLSPGTYYLRVYNTNPAAWSDGVPYPFGVYTRNTPY